MGQLDGKGALVTGGSRGIGRAIVRRLAADGATVVFSYLRNEAAARQVVDEVSEAGGKSFAVQADQGSMRDLDRLFAETDERLGEGLDIVVANAAGCPTVPVGQVTEDIYDQAMAVNVKGPFFVLQYASRRLRDNGRIIVISTLNKRIHSPAVLYCGSKGAMEQFTQSAAVTLGGRGITANIVSPGYTETDLLYESNPGADFSKATDVTALRRLGQPDDIASVVAFLAGPDSKWITAQNILATGGVLA
jgi:3-oxoacyl-[acyl-carrier protein] reductase